jgi:hypothetical protein
MARFYKRILAAVGGMSAAFLDLIDGSIYISVLEASRASKELNMRNHLCNFACTKGRG